MRKQKGTTTQVIDFTASKLLKTDPLSASVIAENVRLIDLTKNLGLVVRGLIKTVQDWNIRKNQSRELTIMPDHLLRDIGIRRDQIPSVVAGDIKRGSLGLSPAGDQSAPAFYKDKDDTPLAA